MSVSVKEAWTLTYFMHPVNAIAVKTCFFLNFVKDISWFEVPENKIYCSCTHLLA